MKSTEFIQTFAVTCSAGWMAPINSRGASLWEAQLVEPEKKVCSAITVSHKGKAKKHQKGIFISLFS